MGNATSAIAQNLKREPGQANRRKKAPRHGKKATDDTGWGQVTESVVWSGDDGDSECGGLGGANAGEKAVELPGTKRHRDTFAGMDELSSSRFKVGR
ncbi:hypothetical protein ACRALDRAFT_2038187 [Sodiomyces alcalophilus JCM 7366]|uniref:uncharacterized protein n=1 Tax=Sodiomyces alcalophilus JCM 7366 TaxID=591952 RepID=UPI0039B4F23A